MNLPHGATSITCREIGEDLNDAWDTIASRASGSGFMQSSAWMAFKRLEGFETPRFGLLAEGSQGGPTLIGGASCIYYPSHSSDSYLIAPQGPIIPWGNSETARACLRMIIAAAEKYAEGRRVLGLRIEPHIERPVPRVLRNWVRAPVDLDPAYSLIIELSKTTSDSDLLGAMHPKGRYNINVAARHGVRVRRSSDMQDLRLFHGLFQETALRCGFFAEPFSFFVNLASALFPCGMAELFIAEHAGIPLSAALVIWFGQRATFLYGGSSSEQRHVMPAYAMHWCAIREARERGCTEYDLYGIDPFGQPDHPYAGFSRFKRQFGGRIFTAIGARDLIFYDRLADRIAEELAKL
jgi:peptidoglycan pentaglycine glycine transferase (the first glycine)